MQIHFIFKCEELIKLWENCYCRQREAEMEEQHDHNSSSTEDASITRNFRYMRRKPTIISYKPPQGKLVQSFLSK